MATERVLVVLGIRMIADNPMPATITQWPKDRRGPKYQHLSPDQLEAMDGDQTAIWEAEFVDGHYWLATRLADDAPLDPLRRPKDFTIDEGELPF